MPPGYKVCVNMLYFHNLDRTHMLRVIGALRQPVRCLNFGRALHPISFLSPDPLHCMINMFLAKHMVISPDDG